MNIRAICPHRSVLGEGPVWDPSRGNLLWVDIESGQILEYNNERKEIIILNAGSRVGCFSICTDGNLIAGTEEGILRINRTTGKRVIVAQPEASIVGNRFNDGKTDAKGRFWAGTMPLKENAPLGSLYRIENTYAVEKLFGEVTISNGICWSHDNRYMYYIDTVKLGVDRFDFDLESGKLSNKTKLITIDPSDGYPDGMTIDAEGMLWVAHWGGWQITRWDPSNGKKIGSIRMPASQITSICFGGTDFKQMYVTSARRGLSAEQLIKEPLAGSTFVIEGSGFVGTALYLFKVDPLLKELN